MKTIVLDANELTRDWLCAGLKYQLLDHMHHATWVSVYVPAVVFEEVVGNHAQAVAGLQGSIERLSREQKRLGIAPVSTDLPAFDYRTYLAELFDERLGFTVLPWPEVPHAELAMRAVHRVPPFDQKGSGYRDSLVWADVLNLARSGHDVALVSADKVFAGGDGSLAAALREEIAPLGGAVELVQDFAAWLIAELPWEVSNLPEAVSRSRDAEFLDYYLKSDFQDDLMPSAEDLGFTRSPYSVVVDEVVWDGDFVPVERSAGPDGVTLVEYDLGQIVELWAEFPDGADLDHRWRVSDPDVFQRVRVEGSVDMVLRVAVLFGGEFGFSIEALSWRRRDGVGPGASARASEIDPSQPSLLD